MLVYILGTMLLAGVVGGLINSYLIDPAVERELKTWQHVIVGVGAAFMVPVFLNMISSHLIADISGADMNPGVLANLLVLAGFCLLAAVSSRAFIRAMTNKILQEVSELKTVAQDAKERAERSEAIAELAIEPEVGEPTAGKSVIAAAQEASVALSKEEEKILRAMISSNFSMRSLSGIAKDAGMSAREVNELIGPLSKRSLIGEGKNKEGQLRWYATARGRHAAGTTAG